MNAEAVGFSSPRKKEARGARHGGHCCCPSHRSRARARRTTARRVSRRDIRPGASSARRASAASSRSRSSPARGGCRRRRRRRRWRRSSGRWMGSSGSGDSDAASALAAHRRRCEGVLVRPAVRPTSVRRPRRTQEQDGPDAHRAGARGRGDPRRRRSSRFRRTLQVIAQGRQGASRCARLRRRRAMRRSCRPWPASQGVNVAHYAKTDAAGPSPAPGGPSSAASR